MGRNRLHPTVLRGDADSRALTVWSTAPAGWIFVPTWPCPACVGNGEVLTMSPHEWHFSAQYESCSEPRGSSAVRDTQRAAISIQCAFHPTRVSLDFRFAMIICTRHATQLKAIERVPSLGCWQASGTKSLCYYKRPFPGAWVAWETVAQLSGVLRAQPRRRRRRSKRWVTPGTFATRTTFTPTATSRTFVSRPTTSSTATISCTTRGGKSTHKCAPIGLLHMHAMYSSVPVSFLTLNHVGGLAEQGSAGRIRECAGWHAIYP